MRTSPLKDEKLLRKIVAQSESRADCLRQLGLRAAGGNYRQLKHYCQLYNISLDFSRVQYRKTDSAIAKNTIPLEDILVENSTYTNRLLIKKRCYSVGLLVGKIAISRSTP